MKPFGHAYFEKNRSYLHIEFPTSVRMTPIKHLSKIAISVMRDTKKFYGITGVFSDGFGDKLY